MQIISPLLKLSWYALSSFSIWDFGSLITCFAGSSLFLCMWKSILEIIFLFLFSDLLLLLLIIIFQIRRCQLNWGKPSCTVDRKKSLPSLNLLRYIFTELQSLNPPSRCKKKVKKKIKLTISNRNCFPLMTHLRNKNGKLHAELI